MTSSNTLKKLVSIGAAMLLAVGGSLVAAEPAHAGTAITASPVLETGVPGAHIQAGMMNLNFSVPGCTLSGTPLLSEFSLTNVGGTQTIQSVSRGGFLSVTLSSVLLGGEQLTLTYTPGTLGCGGSNTLGTVTFTDTAPAAPSFSGTQSINPEGATVTASPATVTSGTATKYWYVCESVKSAASATMTGAPIDAISGCTALFNTAATSSAANTNSISLSGTYYVRAGSAGSYTYPVVSFAGKQVLFAQVLGSTIKYTSSVSGDVVTTTPTTPTVISEEAKPLPVWAAPILKAIPTLSKTLNTDGGKVSLTDGDFSTLKTVTVGGKEVAFSTDAKGNVNIPIPAGAAGTTADLVVTFTGGKMVIQDGIKYVAPTDVAKVAEAGVAGFKANSSKVSGALAASILYAAQIDHKANAIACSGYAASKAQVALATARAQAACDYATGAYSNLTKSTVAVIVNKAKAKSASVGIKVYH